MRQSIDPKFIGEGSAEHCVERGHACSGIMCGCDCHDIPPIRLPIAEPTIIAEADRLPDGAIEIKLPDLSRVALEPGDTLLCRVGGNSLVDMAQAERIRQQLRDHFPGHDVVVLAAAVEVSVVRPRDNGSTTPDAPTED